MTAPSTQQPALDRNLLFGVLAWQLDCITGDALLTALRAWAFDRAKPLGQILHEQGVLSPERQAFLEPLVQEQLQSQGQDSTKRLAAGTLSAPVRPLQGPQPPTQFSLSLSTQQPE